jgi:diguanylate cyclase (GGDEF)-like protein
MIGTAGFILLIIAGMNDILHEQRIIHTAYVWNVGFFFFLFAQSALQAHRFRVIYDESEEVKRDLKQAVAERTMELTQERNKLSRIAKTDELTGLHNRRHGAEQLQNEIERRRRYGGSMVVALLDIDHFKRINDEYGHLVGDTVLKQLSGLLKHSLRKVDYSVRWGGEEFLLFFPHIDSSDGEVVMEKIRKAVASRSFGEEGQSISVTISYGIYTFTGGNNGVEEILHYCDVALYEAKSSGRNRGVVFSSSLSGFPTPSEMEMVEELMRPVPSKKRKA